MALAMTFGLGFADKADAVYLAPPVTMHDAYPYLGKDGHVYANWYYDTIIVIPYGFKLDVMGVYKMYNLEQDIITAVNV